VHSKRKKPVAQGGITPEKKADGQSQTGLFPCGSTPKPSIRTGFWQALAFCVILLLYLSL
ncbi:MAG: hypothetical protein WCK89_00905, partial [bacterium]